MILAADYPLLDIFWTMLIFFGWVIWFWILVTVLTDVFRRHDIGGLSKTGWTAFVIILPFLGVFIYMISQGSAMAERRAKEVATYQRAADEHIRAVAGGNGGGASAGAADEIAKAKSLLDAGVIDQAEFSKLKQRALAV
jgi:hypothetical protein